MTSLVDRTLVTDRVTAATNDIAAADHLPVREAHDLVHITAAFACADKLHQIVADTHHTVRTHNGCRKVVPASDLLLVATELEDQASADLADHLDTAHFDAQALASGLWDDPEIVELRTEVQTLRAQRDAMVTELVRRRLAQCDAIGEHPLTPAQQAAVADECRAYWLHLGEA